MRFRIPLNPTATTTAAEARRHFFRRSGQWLVAGAALTKTTQTLAKLPDVRDLALDHTHRPDSLSLVYAIGGDFVPQALSSLNYFLRDHYNGEVGVIDPQLFNLLHMVRRELKAERPFQVISGYRSPATNDRLRNTRGGGVAQRSLHMDGKAIDVRLPGVPLADLRDAARGLGLGGVGYYPQEQFVHIDTGRVRHWGG